MPIQLPSPTAQKNYFGFYNVFDILRLPQAVFFYNTLIIIKAPNDIAMPTMHFQFKRSWKSTADIIVDNISEPLCARG